MAQCILALLLDGPLQSWGHQSRFDRRTTLSYPTRSGVLGMLSAAAGVDWSDANELRRLEDGLSMTVYAFGRPSLLVDYHTVGGGYDVKRQKQNIVRTADGKVGGTVVTSREYLQDARFGVLVVGERDFLEGLAAALAQPKWGIWLGRKSCIPASPVLQGLFESGDEALEHLVKVARRRRPTRRVREVTEFAEGTDTLMDRPVHFGEREFKPRRIEDEPL